MKLKVSRTKIWTDEAPCSEARRGMGVRVDERTFKTPEKHDASLGHLEPWHSQGKNHRLTEIGIARDFDEMQWFVDFNTLEELMAFVARHGECVLGRDEIEIYDGYRE